MVADSLSRDVVVKGDVSGFMQEVWHSLDGSLCLPAECSAAKVLFPGQSGGCLGGGCSFSPVAISSPLYLPSNTSDSQVVSRLLLEDSQMIVVVLYWPRRSWFPILRSLAVQDPWILPRFQSPIRSPDCLLSRRIMLSVWKLGDGGCRIRE